ncbi:hypothetical protein SLE2022_102890 [Rubroshorea leprosula]
MCAGAVYLESGLNMLGPSSLYAISGTALAGKEQPHWMEAEICLRSERSRETMDKERIWSFPVEDLEFDAGEIQDGEIENRIKLQSLTLFLCPFLFLFGSPSLFCGPSSLLHD